MGKRWVGQKIDRESGRNQTNKYTCGEKRIDCFRFEVQLELDASWQSYDLENSILSLTSTSQPSYPCQDHLLHVFETFLRAVITIS